MCVVQVFNVFIVAKFYVAKCSIIELRPPRFSTHLESLEAEGNPRRIAGIPSGPLRNLITDVCLRLPRFLYVIMESPRPVLSQLHGREPSRTKMPGERRREYEVTSRLSRRKKIFFQDSDQRSCRCPRVWKLRGGTEKSLDPLCGIQQFFVFVLAQTPSLDV